MHTELRVGKSMIGSAYVGARCNVGVGIGSGEHFGILSQLWDFWDFVPTLGFFVGAHGKINTV